MGGLQKATLRYLLICMLVAWCGVVQASDFLRVCQSSMPKAESFLADCRQNARPFKRYFYPGGRGAPVPEEHAAWFDLPDGDSHFAMGCVLGPKGRIDFVGLYFAFKPPNFRIANSTPFTFIDFQGNVGLRPSQGAPFTLLAVRQLRVAGQDRIFTYPDCEIG